MAVMVQATTHRRVGGGRTGGGEARAGGIVSLLDVLQVLSTTYSSLLPSSSELDGQMN